MADDTNPCGSCTLCCKIMGIEAPDGSVKPPGYWCEHCQPGQGCKVHADRPEVCRAFQCWWLRAQGADPQTLDPQQRRLAGNSDLRPDRAKLMMVASQDKHLHVHADPAFAEAWRSRRVNSFLERVVAGGTTVVVVIDQRPRFHWAPGRAPVAL